jgi:hypothetical protein
MNTIVIACISFIQCPFPFLPFFALRIITMRKYILIFVNPSAFYLNLEISFPRGIARKPRPTLRN